MRALPQIGEEIDGFRLLEKMHEGGMAVIYRVSKPGIDLPLIMKLPKLEFGSHPACLVGFEVEQMIMEKLTGPHVPTFIAKGDMAEQPYLVMEYIEGPSLHDYLDQGPASCENIAAWIGALCGALHDVHRQNVVHLDLKPANVLYRADGTAVIIDFGLARHVHLPDLIEETFHKPVGTAAYISPEQVMNKRCDPRSDIFAVGAMLYQLATQHLPFGEPTSLSGFRRRLYLDPNPPRALRTDVPAWLQEITLHCLEVRAEDRYASAAQVAYDLAHPEHVVITARGEKQKRSSWRYVLRRWYQALTDKPMPCMEPTVHLESAAHILVALDIPNADEKLLQALRELLRRAVQSAANSRVTCLTVQEPSILTEEESGRELANSYYTQRLVEMRHWAQPLNLPKDMLRFQVLEASDAAQAVIDFARTHHVDQILVGARGSSVLRRILGSVSAKIAAEAPCNVTVVRVPRAQEF